VVCFSAIIVTVHFQVVSINEQWTWLHHLSIWASQCELQRGVFLGLISRSTPYFISSSYYISSQHFTSPPYFAFAVIWWVFLLAFNSMPLYISLDLFWLFLGVVGANPQVRPP
jgi:hypothetical protein